MVKFSAHETKLYLLKIKARAQANKKMFVTKDRASIYRIGGTKDAIIYIAEYFDETLTDFQDYC